MFQRTEHDLAPWDIIAAEQKRYARIAVIDTLNKRIEEGMRRHGLGMEETFPDFARWAAKRHGIYGLGSTPAAVRKTHFDLAKRLDAS